MSNKIKKGPKPLGRVTGGTPVPQTSHFEHSEKSARAEQDVSQRDLSTRSQQISRYARNDGNDEIMHALATPSHSRIDILHGGSQSATMKDMLKLIRASVKQMEAGESALVINTSASHALMEEAAEKISKRQAASVIAFSATGDDLMQRLEFLANVIQTKGVRLLVVSSFEFAACFSRQRNKLVHWLRRMRDEHNIRIVVYSLERNTPVLGPLGLLAWASDLVREIHNADSKPDFTELPNANQTLLEFIEDVAACFSLPNPNPEEAVMSTEPGEDDMPSFRAQREIPYGQADTPSQPEPNDNFTSLTDLLTQYSVDHPRSQSPSQHLGMLSLKNKELEEV